MATDTLLFCLLGGIISTDVDAAWQSMLSQPLVACPLAGAVLGNIELGLTFGILLQLPFLAELPVGGATVSFGGVGSYVGAGMAIMLRSTFSELPNLVLLSCLLFSLATSVALIPLVNWLRRTNSYLLGKADLAAEAGDLRRISTLHYAGIVNAIAFGILTTGAFLLIGKLLLPQLLTFTPAGVERALYLVQPVLLGAGLGAVARLLVRKKTIPFALTGLLVGAGVMFLMGGR